MTSKKKIPPRKLSLLVRDDRRCRYTPMCDMKISSPFECLSLLSFRQIFHGEAMRNLTIKSNTLVKIRNQGKKILTSEGKLLPQDDSRSIRSSTVVRRNLTSKSKTQAPYNFSNRPFLQEWLIYLINKILTQKNSGSCPSFVVRYICANIIMVAFYHNN